MKKYEAVIGLELHIQLATNSKLFSSSVNKFGASPNTYINEIDLGSPGALPVLNKKAVEFAVLFGYAINAQINPNAVFMRKNYFYPDLPKGYQLSQLDDAIIQGGEVKLEMSGFTRVVRVNRGQLEEDAGKSVHDAFSDRTGIDLNRAGVPLIELVTEPDIRSAKEAVAFMRYIHHLVRYLNISDGNMQEGSFRCDANVSIREEGSNHFNERVELKNINSFRFVEQAINIEIARQSELMAQGKKIEQETRLFDSQLLETRTMRTKEEANDYRYFPDPDLLPLELDSDWLMMLKDSLPELPNQRAQRYEHDYALDAETINYLLQEKRLADYFDEVVGEINDAKLAANWLQGEFARLLNEEGVGIEQTRISPSEFSKLLNSLQKNTISAANAKKALSIMWHEQREINDIIQEEGMQQINDDAQLEQWIKEVIIDNPEQVQAYKNGQEKMLGYFVGQVLKKSKGKANPKSVNEMLKKALLS